MKVTGFLSMLQNLMLQNHFLVKIHMIKRRKFQVSKECFLSVVLIKHLNNYFEPVNQLMVFFYHSDCLKSASCEQTKFSFSNFFCVTGDTELLDKSFLRLVIVQPC